MKILRANLVEFIIVLCITIVMGLLSLTDISTYFENRFYDFRMKYSFSETEISNDITLITIDDKAIMSEKKNQDEENEEFLKKPENWPWKRAYFHDLFIHGINPFKPKSLFFDIIFSEPQSDIVKPKVFIQEIKSIGEDFRDEFSDFEEHYKPGDKITDSIDYILDKPLDRYNKIALKPDTIFKQYIDESKFIYLPYSLMATKNNIYITNDLFQAQKKNKTKKAKLSDIEKWLKEYSIPVNNIDEYSGYAYNKAYTPIKLLRSKKLKGTGFLNVYQAPGIITDDPIARKIPLITAFKCQNKEIIILPHIVLTQIAKYYNTDYKDIKVEWGNKIIIPNKIRKNEKSNIEIPINQYGEYNINYITRIFNSNYPIVNLSAESIRECVNNFDKTSGLETDSDITKSEAGKKLNPTFKNKILVLGITFTGGTDQGRIPVDSLAPNVLIHVNAMNSILTNNHLSVATPLIGFLILFLVNLGLGFCMIWTRKPRGVVIVGSSIFIGYIVLNIVIYNALSIALPLLINLISLSISMITLSVVKFYRSENARAQLRRKHEELRKAYKALAEANDEIKKQQKIITHQQKMSSLGELTAGIAHNLNNPLNYIKSSVEPLKRDIKDLLEIIEAAPELDDDDKIEIEEIKEQIEEFEDLKEELELDYLKEEIEKMTNNIQLGVERSVETIGTLKRFYQKTEERIATDINELIKDNISLCSTQFKDDVDFQSDLSEIPEVECNAGDINQVLSNLITNAAHSITDKYKDEKEIKGIIRIKTYSDSKNVTIEIEDNGKGIPEDIKNRIFEAYFTTKKVGEGTGLGLAISRNTMQSYGGDLKVKSEDGIGATFYMTLPIKAIKIKNKEN